MVLSAMNVKQFLTGNDRGVSPVIGVILMVAVTVVLAAVIGVTVLDLGGEVSETPSASVDYSGGNSMTIISAQNADKITVQKADGTTLASSSADDLAGTQLSWSATDAPSDGAALIVTATVNGDTQVIQEFEYES